MLMKRTPRSTIRRASKQVTTECLVLAGAAASGGFDVEVLAVNTVGIQGGFAFAGKVGQFGCCGLHSEGQFIVGDTAGNFRVVNLFEPLMVEFCKGVQPFAL